MGEADDALNEANNALQNTLEAPFYYYYVAHDLWGPVGGQIKNDSTHQLQYVPKGTDVYGAAGKAGTWLGNHNKTLTRLYIIAHGSPGQFFLGEEVTSENVAPLGGWLQSFFGTGGGRAGIQILGCNCAADSTQVIGKYVYGQANPVNAMGISHRGYELLRQLAKASEQTVEGALHGQPIAGLKLRLDCRRVTPDGRNQIFVP